MVEREERSKLLKIKLDSWNKRKRSNFLREKKITELLKNLICIFYYLYQNLYSRL